MTRILGAAWLIVGALLYSGCSAPAMSRMDDAQEFEQQGDWKRAETVYAGIMTSMISVNEWERVRDARCRARGELVRELVDNLDPPNTTFEEIEEIRSYLERCPDIEEFEAAVSNAGIARAMAEFDEQVAPRLDEGKIYAATLAAFPMLQFLPSDHPYYRRIADARNAEIKRLQAERARFDGYPDSQAVLDLVLTMWNSRNVQKPDSVRSAELAVHRPGAAAIIGTGKCQWLGSSTIPADRSTSGTPFEATAKLRGCSATRAVGETVEDYYETIEVIEDVPKVVAVKTKNTTKTVTEKRSCYTSKNGFGSGCVSLGKSTDTRSYTTITREVVTVKEKVKKQVLRTRPVLQATVTYWAQLVVSVTIEGNSSEVIVPVQVQVAGPVAPPGTPPEAVPGPLDSQLRGALARKANERMRQASQKIAENVQRSEKSREWRAEMESGDEAAAREAAATMWLTAETFEAGNELDDIYGLDIFAVADQPRGLGALPQGVGSTFYASTFSPLSREIPFETVFRRGYPSQSVTVSGQLLDPDPGTELIAQPERTSYGVQGLWSGRFDMFDDREPGFSLITGFDLGVGIGIRTGDDYEAPVPPRDTSIGDEGRVTTAFELAAPVFAGWRADNFHLAVGVRPDWRNFAVGHSWSQGGAVLLTSRIMFRFHPSYPWIFEGWGVNVLGGDHNFQGVQLDIPVFYENWIRLRAEQLNIRTRVYGLNENDPVVVNDGLVEELRLGWVLSF